MYEMYCGKCGNQVKDDAAFCPHCGNPFGKAVPNTPQVNSAPFNQTAILETPAAPRRKKRKAVPIAAGVLVLLLGIAASLYFLIPRHFDYYLSKTVFRTTNEETVVEYTENGDILAEGTSQNLTKYYYDNHGRLEKIEEPDEVFHIHYESRDGGYYGINEPDEDSLEKFELFYDKHYRLQYKKTYFKNTLSKKEEYEYYFTGQRKSKTEARYDEDNRETERNITEYGIRGDITKEYTYVDNSFCSTSEYKNGELIYVYTGLDSVGWMETYFKNGILTEGKAYEKHGQAEYYYYYKVEKQSSDSYKASKLKISDDTLNSYMIITLNNSDIVKVAEFDENGKNVSTIEQAFDKYHHMIERKIYNGNYVESTYTQEWKRK